MHPPGNTWKHHLLALGFRCLCMIAITITGPLVGVDSPPERPDGSEQAPGVAGLLFVAGVVAALVFAFLASILHWLFRRRPLQTILLTDALLAVVFIALIVFNSRRVPPSREQRAALLPPSGFVAGPPATPPSPLLEVAHPFP